MNLIQKVSVWFWHLILKLKTNPTKDVSVYSAKSPFSAGKMCVIGPWTYFAYFIYGVKE